MQQKPTTRRAKGDGSLFKKPMKSGGEVWVGKWNVDGRGVMRSVGPVKSTTHPDGLTPGRAETAFAAMRAEAKAKPDRVKQSKTLADAGEGLLKEKRAAGRKPATLEGIEYGVRIHIRPFFGTTPISKVNKERVEQFRDAMIEDKGLAPKSVANLLGTLHSLFDFAIEHGWTAENPVKRVKSPQSNEPLDFNFLTPEEVEALLRAVPDTPVGHVDRVMYLMAARTGLRQGELLALRWSDIDWVPPHTRVHVRRNYVREQFQSPKSGKGRSVPLTAQVLRELELLHQASRWQGDDDLVFAHPETGNPMERSRLLKRFKAAVAEARVGRFAPVLDEVGKPKVDKDGAPLTQPLFRFHDLRHTFGTQLASEGMAMRKIQEWMGHADFKTTLIYSHFLPGAEDADRIASAFGEAAPELPQMEPLAVGEDPLDRLQRLADLHATGALTADEFAAAKTPLLARL